MQLGFNCFTTTRLMIGAFFLWGRFLCDRFSAAAYNVRGASERTPAKLRHTPKTQQPNFWRFLMSCLCNLFDGDNMWWIIIILLLVLFCCACG